MTASDSPPPCGQEWIKALSPSTNTLVARGVMERSGGATLARVSRPRCSGGLAKGLGYNPGLPIRFSEEPEIG